MGIGGGGKTWPGSATTSELHPSHYSDFSTIGCVEFPCWCCVHTLIFCSAGVEAEYSGLATTLINTLLLSQYSTCATEDTSYIGNCLKRCKLFPGAAYLQKSMSHLLTMGGSSQFLDDGDDDPYIFPNMFCHFGRVVPIFCNSVSTCVSNSD